MTRRRYVPAVLFVTIYSVVFLSCGPTVPVVDPGPGTSLPPDAVTYVAPLDDYDDADLLETLSWNTSRTAISYNIYLGIYGDNLELVSEDQLSLAYTMADPLEYNTKYYWRVDAVNEFGETPGPVWTFTTEEEPIPPAQVTLVSPQNKEVEVEITPTLEWEAAEGADDYIVEFGIDPDTLEEISFEQEDVIYVFESLLEEVTTYYWRVNTLNDNGTTVGEIWSFTTTSPSDLLRITTSALSDAALDIEYEDVVTALGGTGVGYTWSISDGALPDGLGIDGNNVTLDWGEFQETGDVQMPGNIPGEDPSSATPLSEISGVAASRMNPGVLWVHDDSGGGSSFYAIDEGGNVLQKYSVNTSAPDWEDIAIGPGPDSGKEYLYIGDFGDNPPYDRTNCKIIRVEEPIVPDSPGATIELPFDKFYFLYPDGPRDVETMFVDWETQIIYLVQKRPNPVHVYKFPSQMDESWTSSNPVTLIQVGGDNLVPSGLTGGDASRDARRVILRKGGSIWEYARPEGEEFDAIFDQTGHSVSAGVASGQQYEAICYSGDGTSLLTITEKAGHSTIPICRSDADEDPGSTTISGVVTEIGTSAFTVSITDSAGNRASREMNLIVDE